MQNTIFKEKGILFFTVPMFYLEDLGCFGFTRKLQQLNNNDLRVEEWLADSELHAMTSMTGN